MIYAKLKNLSAALDQLNVIRFTLLVVEYTNSEDILNQASAAFNLKKTLIFEFVFIVNSIKSYLTFKRMLQVTFISTGGENDLIFH